MEPKSFDAMYLRAHRKRLFSSAIAGYAVLLLDRDGRIAALNREAERLFRTRERAAVGRSFVEFFAQDSKGRHSCESLLQAAVAQGIARSQCWHLRLDGTRFLARIRLTALKHRKTTLRGYCALIRDKTDQHLAEEERSRLLQELQEAVRARDEFLQVASHELKTPLTTLKLHIDLLRNTARSERAMIDAMNKMPARMEAADRQIQRLTQLVNNLLDISRITGRRMTLDLETLDLSELVFEVTRRFSAQGLGRGPPIEVSVEPSVTGRFDPLRLDQVLTNLISNALKYGAGKPIEVGLRQEGAAAVLWVRDHGIGIAEDDQRRVFERFERAVSGRHFGGLGLGLWIVRKIVQACDGEITVESAPGRGSTFTVRLPRHKAERAEAPEAGLFI